ncbi:MAG: helix-turn-helix transcriptional regulator [Clostridia bacterium]|nr:helix-turn-helix transcriptional regulator [Clostridia bacterium]
MDVNGEMIRGHIDTIILLSLVDGDKDTNEIRRQIEDKSENKFSVKQGTFYSAMQRLVKQNLIREYRSSSNDGIRRKYFNLTDKGAKYVESNKQEWARSRDLIDTLVSDEKTEKQVESVPEKVTLAPPAPIETEKQEFNEFEDPLKDFNARLDELLSGENAYESQTEEVSADESQEEIVADNTAAETEVEKPVAEEVENEEINEPISDNEEIEKTESIVLQAVIEPQIVAENVEKCVDNEKKEDAPQAKEIIIEKRTDNDESLKVAASTEYNLNEAYESDNAPEEKRVYPFEIKDGEIYEEKPDLKPAVEITVDQSIAPRAEVPVKKEEVEQVEIKEEQPTIEEEQPVIAEEVIEEKVEAIAPPPQPSPSIIGRDDLLEVTDGAKTNHREYKSILSSLFPKENNAEEINDGQKEQPIEESKNVAAEIPESVPTRGEVENFRDENISEYERSLTIERNREQTTEKRMDERKQTYGGDSSDFSDLYAMAAREGFKIKTSSNTNKFSGKRILINKLNCVSALTSYMLLFVEMLILNICLSDVLGWQALTKTIIVASTAAFPVLMLLIFAFNHNRKVKEISPFKDAIEISLIATFQITIIILCVALFVSVDFGDFKAVCEFVLLPFILTVNIPIFFIIKYALLSTGRYYVGQE